MKSVAGRWWFAAAASVIALSCAAASPLDVWRLATPLSVHQRANAGVWGAERYVLVGESGNIALSPDGRNWMQANSGTRASLNAITFSAGQFMTVGENGTVLTSTDGYRWESRDTGSTNDLNAVVRHGNQWIVAGDAGTILRSTDAIGWSATQFSSFNWYSLASGNGKILASAGSFNDLGFPLPVGVTATSVDGIDWTELNVPELGANWFRSVAFSNGRFAGVSITNGGGFWTTEDLANWQVVSDPAGWYHDLRATDSGFHVVDRATTSICRSPDGLVWSQARLTNETTSVFGQIFGVPGPDGTVVGARFRFTSPVDAEAALWLVHAKSSIEPLIDGLGTEEFLAEMSFVGDRFFGTPEQEVVLGSHLGEVIAASTDGVRRSTVLTPLAGYKSAPAFGAGQFVSVGAGGKVLVSKEGRRWTSFDSGTTNTLEAVAHADGRFVAVGRNGTILVSESGTNWIQRGVTNVSRLRTISWNNGRWVVTGSHSADFAIQGDVLTSTDGAVWAYHTNGYFKAVMPWKTGFAGLRGDDLVYSEDGRHWTKMSSVPLGSRAASVGGGKIVVWFHSDPVPDILGASHILSSPDGTNWQSHPIPCSSVSDMAFGRGVWRLRSGYDVFLSDPVQEAAPAIPSPIWPGFGSVGTNSVLRVTAEGTSPLTYQWSYRGEPIAGATNELLVLDRRVADPENIQATVSNRLGVASRSVNATPSILSPSLATGLESPNWTRLTGPPGSFYRVQTSDQGIGTTLWKDWQTGFLDDQGEAVIPLRRFADEIKPAAFFRAVVVQ